jgi:hypothetical protein
VLYSNRTGGASYPRAGVYADTVYIENCTFADNNAESTHVPVEAGADSIISNSIFHGNGVDLAGGIAGATGQVSHCCIEDGNFEGEDGNIADDPGFVTGPLGNYYLTHAVAQGGSDSPCVDAGSDTAAALGVDTRTTRTDGLTDEGTADMGYHYPTALPPGAPYIDVAGASVVEGDPPATTSVVFTVTLSRTNNYDVTVAFTTSNDQAEAGTDYTATNGSLTITAGNSTGTVSVTVIGDDELEGDQSFHLVLTNAVNGVISTLQRPLDR